MLFLREVLVSDLFMYRKSSVERGQVWEDIADKLNALEFPKFRVSQRYLRDKLNKLLKWFKKKDREEISASGIDPEMDEKSELLEEILEKMESTVPINLSKKKKDDEDKHTAEEVRKLAMETLGNTQKRKGENAAEKVAIKKRRSGNEAVEFLKERIQQEYELRRAEIEARKHTDEASNKHLEQQQQFQATLVQLLAQQQQDNARQQEQQQEQNMLMMQQQQQILTYLQQVSRKTE